MTSRIIHQADECVTKEIDNGENTDVQDAGQAGARRDVLPQDMVASTPGTGRARLEWKIFFPADLPVQSRARGKKDTMSLSELMSPLCSGVQRRHDEPQRIDVALVRGESEVF